MNYALWISITQRLRSWLNTKRVKVEKRNVSLRILQFLGDLSLFVCLQDWKLIVQLLYICCVNIFGKLKEILKTKHFFDKYCWCYISRKIVNKWIYYISTKVHSQLNENTENIFPRYRCVFCICKKPIIQARKSSFVVLICSAICYLI